MLHRIALAALAVLTRSAQAPTAANAKTVDLVWKDLRLPGILWAVSVVIGLIIVIWERIIVKEAGKP
jgi:hypothetical protein